MLRAPPRREYRWVGPAMLDLARRKLKAGASLAEAAQAVGVQRADLDHALWEDLGAALARRHEPMF